MELQSACGWVHNQLSFPVISPFHPRKAPLLDSAPKKQLNASVAFSKQTLLLQNELKLKSRFRSRNVLCALNSEQPRTSTSPRREPRDAQVNAIDGSEPFRGKPGSVSFLGLTHQSVEESKLVSAPVEENVGSFVWVLAPVALISSLVLPRFFLGNAVVDLFRDELLSEMISSLASEVMFYIGLATFLRVTDHVQKPYLQFSAKRWSLITGLRGYLTSVFFITGFKIFAPLLAVYVTWPVLGLPALVAVAPFLAGCLVQFLFEKRLESRESSSWPLVTIIFEVYRIYQLTRAVQFIQTFMFAMKDAPITQQLLERNGALVSLIVTFQILGVFSLWSLLTFLLRLFPSRPVAENY
ncbi:uncharacterized protein LOC113750863 [Coffea eugenioides]|uniref:uncharacterized protein LOC113750863 n=1 Tax=Coffea eugenioides TaxID=49369 RepID=UPI000F60F8EE|nr:uncharacterized protein LOC113750863 [Coffea eugenioides]